MTRQVVNTRGFGGWSAAARAAWLSKLSKSSTEWMVVREHTSIEECAAVLRADGYETLVATTPDSSGAVPLYGAAPHADVEAAAAADGEWASRRVALLFGSEGRGQAPHMAHCRTVNLAYTLPSVHC